MDDIDSSASQMRDIFRKKESVVLMSKIHDYMKESPYYSWISPEQADYLEQKINKRFKYGSKVNNRRGYVLICMKNYVSENEIKPITEQTRQEQQQEEPVPVLATEDSLLNRVRFYMSGLNTIEIRKINGLAEAFLESKGSTVNEDNWQSELEQFLTVRGFHIRESY